MILFAKIDQAFNEIFFKFSLEGNSNNSHYPFGKLENDGIWEITESNTLKRASVGHLSKKELLDKNICGGFTEQIFQALHNDTPLLASIANHFIHRYFPQEQHSSLCLAMGFPAWIGASTSMPEAKTAYKNNNLLDTINIGGHLMATRQNSYIAYLNSLHNISASGANALAESQALNRYFAELYQPFPLVDALYKMLTETKERVILLTGHAGDGKSTVAFDVLKRLRNLPENEPLVTALNEREEVIHLTPPVFIVKDMSELTAQQRLDWLDQGFNQPGSWLIVSNTGPLINSLQDFTGSTAIESDILTLLDRPYDGGELSSHMLTGPAKDLLAKDLVILNMTRLDNVELGAGILTRMVNHSAWGQCEGCEAETACPLRLNRAALLDMSATVEERVRWIYQRITAYEQRLTLRQMVAHLALSLTGGMSCEEAKDLVNATGTDSAANTEGLERILFSESFFGYRRGESWPVAEDLRAIALVRRSVFGGPTAVDIERQLIMTGGLEGMVLPNVLTGVQQDWRKHAADFSGVRWRFALRRMLYLFGQPSMPSKLENDVFLNTFLHSPKLKDFDHWQKTGGLVMESGQKRALTKSCLQVLLEVYSGFSSGQFKQPDYLYLTLRRSDGAVIQPTQLVVARLDNRDFSIRYDGIRRLPMLSYLNKAVELPLTLPLLDYIHHRSIGSLGNGLAPIHLAQLEWFRAELLNMAGKYPPNEIGLLRSGIDGQVRLHEYVINEQKQRLEQD